MTVISAHARNVLSAINIDLEQLLDHSRAAVAEAFSVAFVDEELMIIEGAMSLTPVPVVSL